MHDPHATANEKEVLKLGGKKKFPVSGDGENMHTPNNSSNTGYEMSAHYFGNEDGVNIPSVGADQNLMNSINTSGQKYEKQEEYSNAITYKDENGQEYLVLEVMDDDGELIGAQSDLQSSPAVHGGQPEYSMFNAVSMTEFLTPVNNANSLHIDNIVIPNHTISTINNCDNPDYNTLIPNETFANSNQSTNMSPNSFTSTAVATYINKPKTVGPSRFIQKDELDFDSASTLRTRDLASCFGFDSDEE